MPTPPPTDDPLLEQHYTPVVSVWLTLIINEGGVCARACADGQEALWYRSTRRQAGRPVVSAATASGRSGCEAGRTHTERDTDIYTHTHCLTLMSSPVLSLFFFFPLFSFTVTLFTRFSSFLFVSFSFAFFRSLYLISCFPSLLFCPLVRSFFLHSVLFFFFLFLCRGVI